MLRAPEKDSVLYGPETQANSIRESQNKQRREAIDRDIWFHQERVEDKLFEMKTKLRNMHDNNKREHIRLMRVDGELSKQVERTRKRVGRLASALLTHVRTDMTPDAALPEMMELCREIAEEEPERDYSITPFELPIMEKRMRCSLMCGAFDATCRFDWPERRIPDSSATDE